MRNKTAKYGCQLFFLLTVTSTAYADGGISSLGALLDMLLLFVGAIGLVIVPMVISAIRARRSTGEVSKASRVFLGIAYLYVLFAVPVYFASQTSEFAKFPGFLAAALISLICVFHIQTQKKLLTAVLAVTAVGTATLLATPASFWKGNAFDMIAVNYVDNTNGLEVIRLVRSRDRNCHSLPLPDGRIVVQFTCTGEKPAQSMFADGPRTFFTLREIDTQRTGQSFEVIHYKETSVFHRSRASYYSPPRYSLFQRDVDKYVTVGIQSDAVLLNEDAEFDSQALLLDALGNPGAQSLGKMLIEVSDLDVNNQSFIDIAFKNTHAQTIRDLYHLGVSSTATDSGDQTFLHRAAEFADVEAMRGLVSRGADLNATDSSGRTPIQLFREKHAKKNSLIRDLEEAFPDDHSQ